MPRCSVAEGCMWSTTSISAAACARGGGARDEEERTRACWLGLSIFSGSNPCSVSTRSSAILSPHSWMPSSTSRYPPPSPSPRGHLGSVGSMLGQRYPRQIKTALLSATAGCRICSVLSRRPNIMPTLCRRLRSRDYCHQDAPPDQCLQHCSSKSKCSNCLLEK